MELTSMGRRAWFAYQCLPRDEMGRMPPIRRLERENDLSNGAIGKLIWDELTRPSYQTMLRLAKALGCSEEWLTSGTGDGPVARFPVAPRPDKKPKRSGIGPDVVADFEDETGKLTKRRPPSRRRDARK